MDAFGKAQRDSNDSDYKVLNVRGKQLKVSNDVIDRVPFLKAQIGLCNLTFQKNTNDNNELLIDQDYFIVRAILRYVESGNGMYLFTKLPCQFSATEILSVLNYFCIEYPSIRQLDDSSFKNQLKDVKDDVIKICRTVYETTKANRFGARNAAAEFAIGLEISAYDLTKNRTMNYVYNYLLFIISHSRTFGPRLRHHIWNLAIKKINFTPNQNKELNRWISDVDDDSDSESDKSQSSDDDDDDDDYDDYGDYYNSD